MRITGLYYLGFDVDVDGAPFTPEVIKNDRLRIPLDYLTEKSERIILSVLFDSRIRKGRFHASRTRLRVEVDDHRHLLLVDEFGCVKNGSDEYFMFPHSFLYLYRMMLRAQNNELR